MGVILSNARAMGEFGAVSVVSGHIRGLTNTIPLYVEISYNEYQFVCRILRQFISINRSGNTGVKTMVRYVEKKNPRITTGTQYMTIKIQQLNKHFGQFHALKDINLSFPENQLTALLGPSGLWKNNAIKDHCRIRIC